AYGCAFDQFMTDNNTVYVKLDDDIIFIKDGSIEHLVLAVLTNKDYSFYSGSVVNNPHSYAVHQFIGAHPPVTYHWQHWSPRSPPYVPYNVSGAFYYGKNMYDSAGSSAHEAFIYNVASNRLDVYGYGIWNQNECLCGKGQIGLYLCKDGFYRWNINVFAYLREGTLAYKNKIPGFDEPAIGMGWPKVMPPNRVGMLGEALFVHYEV
ncbi:MAG: hypothetical protein P4L87_26440, partial [Formivibrio sp.]|nr:hypothetical protein [Formivibrio sp.]